MCLFKGLYVWSTPVQGWQGGYRPRVRGRDDGVNVGWELVPQPDRLVVSVENDNLPMICRKPSDRHDGGMLYMLVTCRTFDADVDDS